MAQPFTESSLYTFNNFSPALGRSQPPPLIAGLMLLSFAFFISLDISAAFRGRNTKVGESLAACALKWGPLLSAYSFVLGGCVIPAKAYW